jgi:hypothetical protein
MGDTSLNKAVDSALANGSQTFWVEWVGAVATSLSAVLTLEMRIPPSQGIPAVSLCSDALSFYPFTSIVVIFGGNGTEPLAAGEGMFVIAQELYEDGYDVHAYNEEDVDASELFNTTPKEEVVSAASERGVTKVAIMGYSQGGGAAHYLANQLNGIAITAGLLAFTAYVDAIQHDDWDAQDVIPPGSLYHVNYYQHSGLRYLWDPINGTHVDPNGLLLEGEFIAAADFNLDVRTTTWGATLNHLTIDDSLTIINRLQNGLAGAHDGVKAKISR